MFCIRESVPELTIQQNDKPTQKEDTIFEVVGHPFKGMPVEVKTIEEDGKTKVVHHSLLLLLYND